LQINKK